MEDLLHLIERLRAIVNYSFGNIGGAEMSVSSIIEVLVFLVAAWWLSKLIRLALHRVQQRGNVLAAASVYALDRIVHYLLMFMGLLVGLSAVGVDFTTFTVLAGALGVGVGLGLQSLVANFVSGIILLVERSLKVGDFIELESGVRGEVKQINIRSTMVTTNDNIDVLIPNLEFIQGRVINWTLSDEECRIHVPFGVAYGSDKETVRVAALEAAERVPQFYASERRKPQVWLVGFGDSSLDFELLVWLGPEQVRSPSAVQAAYLWELHSALERHGIEIPFPQRDLHVRSVFGHRQGAPAELLTGRGQDADASGG